MILPVQVETDWLIRHGAPDYLQQNFALTSGNKYLNKVATLNSSMPHIV